MDEFTIIDSYLGQKEIPIRTENELREKLQAVLKTGINQIIILHSFDSGDLTLGIGTPYGFAEYMDSAQKPPYLITKDKSGEKKTEYNEFYSGGTPTPIPVDNCILIDRVFEIATYFFWNSKLPTEIEWEEE